MIWGEGKIWKVDLNGGAGLKTGPSGLVAGVQIPFTVKVEQAVNDAVRFPQKVHSDDLPVRMLRDVTTSPDGKLVAYSALGRIYVKPIPTGEPRVLTGTSGTSGTWMESDPRFSPDGQWIVFAAWNDANLGRIRAVRVDGSGARDVIAQPGHYVEPSFSPDGKQIVYRRTSPDGIRGITHAGDPGIYVVSADGTGQPSLVREAGSRPQFDHTGKRIYFRERRGEKFVLASLEVDGSDEIVHLQSDNATQIEPSPDGKYVRVRRAVARLHRVVPALGPRDRSGAERDQLPRRADLARRRLLDSLVRRRPPGPLVARARVLHARPGPDVRVPGRRRKAGRA